MSIGEKIRSLRESRGLSQTELAEIIGVTDGAVSQWERDNFMPRMGAIQKMANYFGVSKSEIIEDGMKTPPAKAEDVRVFLQKALLNEGIDIELTPEDAEQGIRILAAFFQSKRK